LFNLSLKRFTVPWLLRTLRRIAGTHTPSFQQEDNV
jgi:hypothetical protein